MAQWAENGWMIQTEAVLDRYTFGVAYSVGLLLSDLWAWYNGTQTNHIHAIGFGRGLQAINILRNHAEDVARGVEFFPPNWRTEDMHAYARRNLALADAYTNALPPGPALAYATLDSLAREHGEVECSAVGLHSFSRGSAGLQARSAPLPDGDHSARAAEL